MNETNGGERQISSLPPINMKKNIIDVHCFSTLKSINRGWGWVRGIVLNFWLLQSREGVIVVVPYPYLIIHYTYVPELKINPNCLHVCPIASWRQSLISNKPPFILTPFAPRYWRNSPCPCKEKRVGYYLGWSIIINFRGEKCVKQKEIFMNAWNASNEAKHQQPFSCTCSYLFEGCWNM